MREIMKPGYYLSERGNFQVWYPLDFFKKGIQRVDVVYEDGTIEDLHYTKIDIILINVIFEFEFIGEL